uniref:LAGLIDADG homing endonuclease n=1 Tax=Romanomermis culicivorax TaxID=13658 RepID=A0A915KR53_ROMCU
MTHEYSSNVILDFVMYCTDLDDKRVRSCFTRDSNIVVFLLKKHYLTYFVTEKRFKNISIKKDYRSIFLNVLFRERSATMNLTILDLITHCQDELLENPGGNKFDIN